MKQTIIVILKLSISMCLAETVMFYNIKQK